MYNVQYSVLYTYFILYMQYSSTTLRYFHYTAFYMFLGTCYFADYSLHQGQSTLLAVTFKKNNILHLYGRSIGSRVKSLFHWLFIRIYIISFKPVHACKHSTFTLTVPDTPVHFWADIMIRRRYFMTCGDFMQHWGQVAWSDWPELNRTDQQQWIWFKSWSSALHDPQRFRFFLSEQNDAFKAHKDTDKLFIQVFSVCPS